MAFDRTILEVVTAPGYFSRMARLGERSLARLAAFRRNSDWATRLEFSGGHYKPRSTVSSLVLATEAEMNLAFGDRVLSDSGITESLLACVPSGVPLRLPDRPDPGGAWELLVALCLMDRLEGKTKWIGFSATAKERFLRLLDSRVPGEASPGWNEREENYPCMVAKLALCVSLFRGGEAEHVNEADLGIAVWIARHLSKMTRKWVRRPVEALGEAPDKPIREEPTEANQISRLVRKLRSLEPCSRRTLFRTYSRPDYAGLVPLLDRAVELGMVSREGAMLRVGAFEPETVGVSSSDASAELLTC